MGFTHSKEIFNVDNHLADICDSKIFKKFTFVRSSYQEKCVVEKFMEFIFTIDSYFEKFAEFNFMPDCTGVVKLVSL